jgi:glycosyltransferase involved in cell wall biosynthesis
MSRPTLWIDVTELFGQFAVSSHLTGVSRVIVHLFDALAAEPGAMFGTVRPVFWHPVRRATLTTEGAGFGRAAEFFPGLRQRYAAANRTVRGLRPGIEKALVTAIPKPSRYRLFPFLNGVTHFLPWASEAGIPVSEAQFAPGDCLFVPGSFWLDGYAPRLAAAARGNGAAVAAYVHDVLLLSHPEWMPPGHAEQFRRGAEAFLPHCSAIACNSAYTRDDLRARVALPPDMPITVCRLAESTEAGSRGALPPAVAGLSGSPYALFVSTLTPRKNHRLLVAAWRKLRNALGEEAPWLVFAGGGAPDAALAEEMRSEASEGARVIRLTGVDDTALEALYAGAWLTLYPSLGEGYGLPVAEALARGKVCLATRCGGLAEVAPDLVDAIDPFDTHALVERLLHYLDHPERLAAREAEIRSRFRRTEWSDTARAVGAVLEQAVVQGASETGTKRTGQGPGEP